jgi:ankyrin repeat protein
MTALQTAAENFNADLIKYLLDNGAKLDPKDDR